MLLNLLMKVIKGQSERLCIWINFIVFGIPHNTKTSNNKKCLKENYESIHFLIWILKVRPFLKTVIICFVNQLLLVFFVYFYQSLFSLKKLAGFFFKPSPWGMRWFVGLAVSRSSVFLTHPRKPNKLSEHKTTRPAPCPVAEVLARGAQSCCGQ